MNTNNCLIILILIGLGLLLWWMCRPKREGYRDPLYLNRAKMIYDWYPRANGSIYGFPFRYGGSWSMFSGYPYYWKAY